MSKNTFSLNYSKTKTKFECVHAGPEFVEFSSLPNSKIMYLGGNLAQFSYCSILTETPPAGKAVCKNDLSIAPSTVWIRPI